MTILKQQLIKIRMRIKKANDVSKDTKVKQKLAQLANLILLV